MHLQSGNIRTTNSKSTTFAQTLTKLCQTRTKTQTSLANFKLLYKFKKKQIVNLCNVQNFVVKTIDSLAQFGETQVMVMWQT